jgi:hypothetical protein
MDGGSSVRLEVDLAGRENAQLRDSEASGPLGQSPEAANNLSGALMSLYFW